MTASTVTKLKNVNKKGEKRKKSLSASKQKGMKSKNKVKNSASEEKIYTDKKKNNQKKVMKKTVKGNKAVKGKGMKKKKQSNLVDQKKKNEEKGGINITSSQVNQAIEGIRVLTKQKQEKEKETKKKELLHDENEDGFIYLQVGMVKVAGLLEKKNIIRPVKIKVFLPHSLVNSNTDVLLITKDDNDKKDIRDDHTETLHRYQHKLRMCGAARHISEVITLRQLKVEFKEYEAKRHLSNRIDVVLCDDTIIRRIPMFLGNNFYKKKKYPVQVNLKNKNLLAEIERALTMQLLLLPMTGNSALVKIGRLDQTNEMIEENIWALIKKCKQKFPGGFENIQSLSLKSERTKSVPIYFKIGDINDIGEIVPKPLSNRVSVTGEVSTQFGNIYTLTPNSDIKLVKKVLQWKIDARERREQRNEEKRLRAEKQKEENVESEDLKEGEAPKKRKKVSGDLIEGEVPKRKKKVSGDLIEGEVPKKKKMKKVSGKKGKKTECNAESLEDEKLDQMEREYLKRINMELEDQKVEGKKTKKNAQPDDDDDDWAEISDDDMSSNFNDEL